MGSFSTFKFTADTIDGCILEFPKEFDLRCDKVNPIGETIIRQYDGNECIVAREVFLVYYCGQTFGTTQFKTLDQFLAYRNASCVRPKECNLSWNGCSLINNCVLKYIK